MNKTYIRSSRNPAWLEPEMRLERGTGARSCWVFLAKEKTVGILRAMRSHWRILRRWGKHDRIYVLKRFTLLAVERSVCVWVNIETGSQWGESESFKIERGVAWTGASSGGGKESIGPMGTGGLWTSILSAEPYYDWDLGNRAPEFKFHLELLITMILDKLCTFSESHLLQPNSRNNTNSFKGHYDV